MIVTVTTNPALDVTYGLDRLVPNHSHRTRWIHQRAGGKGINVARVLHQTGCATRVITTAGGSTGQLLRADLASAELPNELVQIAGETRRTVALVSEEDDSQATLINESGVAMSTSEWQALRDRVRDASSAASVVVFAGSLPPDAPEDVYARLIELARAQGAATVLDSSGAALDAGLAAEPDVVKPNAAELAELTRTNDPGDGAAALRSRGARNVVVSLGSAGLLAVTDEGCWQARPGRAVTGNPTGAGDAVVAALAAGMRDSTPWPERLRNAIAVSTAAVAAPVAGDIDTDHYHAERAATRVRTVDGQENRHDLGSHR